MSILTRSCRLAFLTAVPALLVTLVTPARAQGAGQQTLAALKSGLEQNAAAQRNYTWLQTTELALNGEVKSTETAACQYYQGQQKPTCTSTSGMSDDEKKKRGIRGHVVEKKTDEYKAYMDSVKTLIAEYAPPQKTLIEKAEAAGGVSVAPNQPGGAVKLTIANYLQQGDAMAISFNPQANALTGVNVNTWLNDPKATVTLAVTYVTLPNGVTFAQQKVLTATAKGIVITISSSNFAQAVAQ